MRADLELRLETEFSFMRDMCCECGDGWYELLRQMCAEIIEVYSQKGLQVDIEILQIKEKYGLLCFYYNTPKTDPTIHNLIRKIAEKYKKKSEQICESCGAVGRLRNDSSWVRTSCDSCLENA